MKRVVITLVAVALFGIAAFAQELEPPRIDIYANRYQFTPNEITLRKDVTVTLRLTSDEPIHRVQSKDLRINVDLRPNQPHDVTITPGKAGRFELTSANPGGATLIINVAP